VSTLPGATRSISTAKELAADALSQIIEDVLLELYTIRRRSKCGETTLCRLNNELDAWLAKLPPDLTVAAGAAHSPPPNRITLALLYCATVILVNRPFSFGGWGPRIRVDEAVQARAKHRCRDGAHSSRCFQRHI
jgi:hypothetical protein